MSHWFPVLPFNLQAKFTIHSHQRFGELLRSRERNGHLKRLETNMTFMLPFTWPQGCPA